MNPSILADADERAISINPAYSCIVQAPAGSGKTGLLTQRFLRLLLIVDQPEEIIAITFTRKACAEMRKRIVNALEEATAGIADDAADAGNEHQQRLRQLARAVAKRDRQRQWQLTEHPARLQILTIDSLCHGLVQRMPWLAKSGGSPTPIDDPKDLYRQAVDWVLEQLDDDTDAQSDIAQVLEHLDGDIVRLRRLLADFLQRREQWLQWLLADGEDPRRQLKVALERILYARIQSVACLFPEDIIRQLLALVKESVNTATATIDSTPLIDLAAMNPHPDDPVATQCAYWKTLAKLLLTGDGHWRKRLDKRQGFAADGNRAKQRKQEALELIDRLQAIKGLDKRLQSLCDLPLPASYADDQWQALTALINVSRLAAAALRVVFSEQNCIDFSEVAMAAILALGPEDAPTDLGLIMDYRIRHLLIDEYQDTSHTHHALITRLLVGWLPDDGRTLFVVGDPMQSIYRFRQADVGLFINSMTAGIGAIGGADLKRLHLKSNFRSCSSIVDWVNRTFSCILTEPADAISGAAEFRPSVAAPDETLESDAADRQPAVSLHPFASGEDDAEAEHIAGLIANERQQHPDPEYTIAVLVRTRAHAHALLPKLNARKIAWRGVKLQPLQEIPLIIDLTSLARAISHVADRIAWLALLRAPWCGLSLADLHCLVEGQPQALVIDLLHDQQRLATLDAAAQQRLQRLRVVMSAALAARGKRPLRRIVEGAWLAVGGPACVSPTALPDAERFLQRLDAAEQKTGGLDPDDISALADNLYSEPAVIAGAVEIMTIHQAKGLEFDAVFVPCLNRHPRANKRQLIEWTQTATLEGNNSLLLAPWSLPKQPNPIRDLIVAIEGERDRHEIMRLAYVATTRPRARLYLSACCDIAECQPADDKHPPPKDTAPAANSLLAMLWPAIEDDYRAAAESAAATGSEPDADPPADRRQAPIRLPLDWSLPSLPPDLRWRPVAAPAITAAITFEWVSHAAIAVGHVVHRLLKVIADEGLTHWNLTRAQAAQTQWRHWLVAAGINDAELDAATWRVSDAITAILNDERGRWLLTDHSCAASELAITGVIANNVRYAKIDRTFVDQQGRRVIVDYKTGHHAGSGLDQFLDREQQRYRNQLEDYAHLLLANSGGTAQLGLYFPLHRGWREWSFEVAAAADDSTPI